MDERDIFDEEFDRLNSQPDDTTDPFGSWSSYNVQPPVQPTQRKPLKIVLIAISIRPNFATKSNTKKSSFY